MNSSGTRKRVVIVGGGFAGIVCARELVKSSDVQITLIDKNNYHQVARYKNSSMTSSENRSSNTQELSQCS